MARKVGVIGLGTAGTAASLFLARRGIECTIIEKTSQLACNNPVGAGIGIQPIGLTVLKRLGLLDNVLSHGHRIESLKSVTETGRTVLDLSYADFRPELYGLGVHRTALFQALHDAAKASPNIDLVYGTEITALDIAGEGGARENVCIRSMAAAPPRHGRSACSSSPMAAAPSRVRRQPGPRVPHPFGARGPSCPTRRACSSSSALTQVLSSGSAHEMLGFLPSGRTPDMAEDEPSLVSLFWSLEMDTVDAVRARGLDAWKQRVLELEPRAADLLGHLTSMDALIPAAYSDTFMPSLFHGDSTVFLGDCAHATSPQLGQGANLALVDAWQLARSMAACDDDPARAVRHYDDARRWRLRFYQLNSRVLTPVFQSRSRLVGRLRDALFGPLCYFPPTRWQMLTTLVGAQANGVPFMTIPEEEFLGYLSPGPLAD